MPTIDVVYYWPVFPLPSIGKLHHVYNSSGAIETIEEFMFHLVPIIDRLRCKVYVLIEKRCNIRKVVESLT